MENCLFWMRGKRKAIILQNSNLCMWFLMI